MDIKKLNEEANKIWHRLASDSTAEMLRAELDLYKKLLEFFQVGESYYLIFNFKKLEFDLISEEIEKVLGYQPSEINMPFLMGKLHPEDQSWFLTFENKVVDFFSQLPLDKLMKYKVRYDFRIKKKNGNYIRILHQVVVAEHDNTGAASRTLVAHTDITYLKQEGKPVLSFIGMDGEPSYLNVGSNNIFVESKEELTKREKQILALLIDGKLSKEISNILKISKQTVDTHRKNMLHKNNLSNTGELIGKAIRYGWI
jgi:DNA-binding CsgD family transcriptional regulator